MLAGLGALASRGRAQTGRRFNVVLILTDQEHSWETLPDALELYDTEADPDEMVNLAFEPELHKDRVLELNALLSGLLDEEVGLGLDDGSHMPGDATLWES